MADAILVHQLGTLRPIDDAGKELLSHLKQGETVRVAITKPRNVRFHRLFWALMQKVHDNLPDDKRERYPTAELLVAWFKVATGHCDMFQVEGRGTVYLPKSISFAKMDNIEFSKFFDRCCQLVALHFIPEVSPEAWRREVEQMIGIAA